MSTVAGSELPEHLPSGVLRLDLALQGGLPRARATLISGAELTGKTTLFLHCVAQVQLLGGLCAWIDTDNSLDPGYATRLGVDPFQALVSCPTSLEQTFGIAQELVRSGALALLVIDSLTALLPDLSLETPHNASGAWRALYSRLSLLRQTARARGTALLLSYQSGPFIASRLRWLAPSVETSLAFSTDLHLRLQTLRPWELNGVVMGSYLYIDADLPKISDIGFPIELKLLYNEGVVNHYELFDLGCVIGVISRQKEEYFFRDDSLGRGQEQVLHAMNRQPQLCQQIEQAIRQQGLPPPRMPVEG